MRPFHLIAALAVGIGAMSVTGLATARDAVAPARADLVQACRVEAVRGHLRHLATQRNAIDAHKRRMTDVCDRWSGASAVDREPLLRSCMKEAAWGARHVHRGGNYDRTHLIRLQRLCEQLAAV